MSEYREKRTIAEDIPIGRTVVGSRPIVETQYESVVHERQGMSGLAVGALVLAAIAAAIVITMLVFNSQQKNTDQEMADRARIAAAQQTSAQPSQQAPIIVNVPPSASQPAAAPITAPPPSLSAPTAAAPSSVDVELDVTSKLLDDQELRSYSVDVKVSGGIATLSGRVPNEDLKARAETVARTVKGVRSVVNNIDVRS
jgi:type II secretory pathway pseudopilin PulG